MSQMERRDLSTLAPAELTSAERLEMQKREIRDDAPLEVGDMQYRSRVLGLFR
jgi:hypothetical protein